MRTRIFLALSAALLPGCMSARPRPEVAAAPCPSERAAWALTAAAPRTLRVSLVVADESHHGWTPYGQHRLKEAVAAWNALQLPLRLATTADFRGADIRVAVVRSLPGVPGEGDHLQRYRAGVTRLDTQNGIVERAHIGIAELSPLGVPYTVAEQLATLVHELGHAMGLPHATHTMALMSAQAVVTSLTVADRELARRTLRPDACRPAATVVRR